jgi:hypothetical protein
VKVFEIRMCKKTTERDYHAAAKVADFVIPSEARNLSSGYAEVKKARVLASLGMTKSAGRFFRTPLQQSMRDSGVIGKEVHVSQNKKDAALSGHGHGRSLGCMEISNTGRCN